MNQQPYTILEAPSLDQLEQIVLSLIQDGYIPTGGVAFASLSDGSDYHPVFFQAMILRSLSH